MPPAAGDPHHLVGHPPRVAARARARWRSSRRRRSRRANGRLHAAADDRARRDLAEPGELADVGVQGEVRRARRLGTRRGSSPGRRRRRAAARPSQVDVAARAGRRSPRPARCRSGPGRAARSGTRAAAGPSAAGGPPRTSGGRRGGLGTRDPTRARRPGHSRCAGPTSTLAWPDARRRRCSPDATSSSSAGATPSNPEGGGAERYLEKMAAGLVERGCPGHHLLRRPRRPRRPTRSCDGVRFVRRGSKLTVYLAGHAARCAAATLGAGRRRRRRAERPAVLHPRWSPAGPSSCSSTTCTASSGRSSTPASRPGRLVDRAPARAVALPPLPVRRGLARHPRRAARRSASGAAGRGRAQRHRPGRARRPPASRPRRRSRVVGRLVPHKQVEHAIDAVARAARGAPRTAARTSSAAAGGRASCTRTPRRAAPATRSSSRATSTRSASTRSTSAAWVLAAALAQGGLGAGGRRGRHARAPRRWPTARPAAPASRSRTALRGAGRRPRRASPTRRARLLRDHARRTRARRRGAADEPRLHLAARAAVVRPGGGRGLQGELVDSQDPEELDDVMQTPAPPEG